MNVFHDRNITPEFDPSTKFPGLPPAAYAAILGFGGEKIRGAVMVCAPKTLVEKTHPVAGHEPLQPNDLDDWIGEIANRCVGRLKNILRSHGVQMNQALPVVIKGMDINPTSMIKYGGDTPYLNFNFKCQGSMFSAWFAGTLDPSVDLSQSAAPPSGQLEGDLLLF